MAQQEIVNNDGPVVLLSMVIYNVYVLPALPEFPVIISFFEKMSVCLYYRSYIPESELYKEPECRKSIKQ